MSNICVFARWNNRRKKERMPFCPHRRDPQSEKKTPRMVAHSEEADPSTSHHSQQRRGHVALCPWFLLGALPGNTNEKDRGPASQALLSVIFAWSPAREHERKRQRTRITAKPVRHSHSTRGTRGTRAGTHMQGEAMSGFFHSQQRRAHSTLRQSLPLEGLLQNLQGDDERKHISIPSQKQQHRRKAHAHNTDGGMSTSSHSQDKRVHRAHCPSPPLEDQHKKKSRRG